jgi:hypothetical protein
MEMMMNIKLMTSRSIMIIIAISDDDDEYDDDFSII